MSYGELSWSLFRAITLPIGLEPPSLLPLATTIPLPMYWLPAEWLPQMKLWISFTWLVPTSATPTPDTGPPSVLQALLLSCDQLFSIVHLFVGPGAPV